MGDIVVASRQITHAHESAGGCTCKVRNGYGISSRVGLVLNCKNKRVNCAVERVCAAGPLIAQIFVQCRACQKPRCLHGGGPGDSVSVKMAKCDSAVAPVVWVVIGRIGHPYS